MKTFLEFIKEEATTTASIDVTPSVAAPMARRKWKDFDVSPECFEKFSKGRRARSHWKKLLNLQDEVEKGIYDYAKKNSRAVIVLRNSSTGAIRSIRNRANNE